MSGWTFPSTPLIHLLELSEFDHLDNLGNEESTGAQCLLFHFDRRQLSTQESTLFKVYAYSHHAYRLLGAISVFWGRLKVQVEQVSQSLRTKIANYFDRNKMVCGMHALVCNATSRYT